MTSADPSGGGAAGREPGPPRRLSPPPPLYDESDEISLEDPVVHPEEPAAESPAATLRGSGPEHTDRATGPGVRVGRPVRMLWFWVGPGCSALGLVVGATLFSLGMSVRQAIVAAAVGAAIAVALLVVGVLDGRRTGLPGEAASPASFGVIGSRAICLISLLVRVLWAAVLLWASALVVAGLVGAVALVPVLIGAAVVIVGGVAAVGYRAVAPFQLVATALGSLTIIAVVAGSASRVDLPVAMGIGDGPPLLVLGGTVTVFSIVALTVVPVGASIGRYQGAGSTSLTAIWSAVGVLVPVLLVVGWGALVAAGNPSVSGSLATAPIDGLAAILPDWARLLLAAAAGLGVLSALVLAAYGGGIALRATGVPIGRMPATVAVTVAAGAIALLLSVEPADLPALLQDIVPTLAVPIVAVAAVSAGRALARGRRSPGPGDVPGVRWYESAVLVAAVVVGYGLMSASPAWLSWQGYLFAAAGVPLDSELAASDPGVLLALVIGALALFSVGTRRPRSRGGSHRVAAGPGDTGQ